MDATTKNKTTALACMLATLGQAETAKCNALVLSGGGTNGAWEAGVLWGLTHYGEPSDFMWDVHSGISAGSINTIGQVGWESSQTVEATEYLSDMWASVTNKDVYRIWDGHGITGLVESCLLEVSCFDTTPLLLWLQNQLLSFTEVKRRFSVSAVDVQTGDFITFNQTNIDFEDIPQAALSSSSIPGAFPPQQFKGHLLMDGGTVWNVDTISAINQCLEMVESEEDVIVDILICSDYEIQTEEAVPKNSYQDFIRGRQINSFYHDNDNLMDAMKAFPDVEYRYLFLEQNPFEFGLDFRNETTWPKQLQGRQDAQDQLEAARNGFNGFQVLSEWKAAQDGTREQATFGEYFKAKLEQALAYI